MGATMYPWQAPFVADVEPVEVERHVGWDLYRPVAGGGGQTPAVVFVHGGPLPAGLPVPAKDWPLYRGYAALAARAGLVAAVIDHGLHGPADYPAAFANIRTAIDAVRHDNGVDADRMLCGPFPAGHRSSHRCWRRRRPGCAP